MPRESEGLLPKHGVRGADGSRESRGSRWGSGVAGELVGVKGVGGAGGGVVRQWGMKAFTSWAPPEWHIVPSGGHAACTGGWG